MANDIWVREVLDFWFEELADEAWFTTSDETDAAVAKRFGKLHRDMSSAIPASALLTSEAALAGVIVLDQFPRNIYRGTAEAFATDPLALALSRNALACGFDDGMADRRRQFLYMPFMHSENLADQTRCVELFGGMGGENLSYANQHREIIERFGHFPHRNRALGRATSEAEAAFLVGHDGFGQSKP